jgi:hypothetical protein
MKVPTQDLLIHFRSVKFGLRIRDVANKKASQLNVHFNPHIFHIKNNHCISNINKAVLSSLPGKIVSR